MIGFIIRKLAGGIISYIESNNPVAAALLSKMGYNEKEKVQVKKEFLRMVARMELNPAKARYINDFFERYLTLNKMEEEKLMKEINEMENAEEIFKLTGSWEEKGIRKGIEKGKKAEKKQIAFEMLKEGSSVDFVAKVTKLDIDEIREIKKQLKEQ